jgi:hypothetical protein
MAKATTISPDLSKGVTIRDPGEGESFRCNPDPASQFPAWVVRDPDSPGRYYVVARHLIAEVQRRAAGKVFPAVMHMCMIPRAKCFLYRSKRKPIPPHKTEGLAAAVAT